MKRMCIIPVILWLSAMTSFAQQTQAIEQELERKVVTCYDIQMNAVRLLPDLFRQDKLEDVRYICEYTIKKCGISEPIFRALMLYHMAKGSLTPEIVASQNGAGVGEKDDYHSRRFQKSFAEVRVGLFLSYLRMRKGYTYRITPIADEKQPQVYVQLERELMETFFTAAREYAVKLTQKFSKDQAEYWLCLFYSEKFEEFFKAMWEPDGAKTWLHTMWQDYRRAKDIEPDVWASFNREVNGGIWMPQGPLGSLGMHPTIGLYLGVYAFMVEMGINGSVRFLDSPVSWTGIRDGVVCTGNNFVGSTLSVDVALCMRLGPVFLQALGGIGWDAVWAPHPTKANTWEDFSTVNLSTGLGLKCYFGHLQSVYLYLEGRYNFLWYNSNGGTDLSGGAVTARLGLGISLNNRNSDYEKRKSALKQVYAEPTE